MAFNYFGNPYAPQYYPQTYPQQMAQPQMQTANAAIPQAQVSNVWIYSKAEVEQYPVAPNNAVRLWDANAPVFYLKWADATGKPSVKVYDIVERAETTAASEEQGDKTHPYATKEELGTVATAVKSILDEIETIKGDMYGIAGKKKPVKKVEAEDDT